MFACKLAIWKCEDNNYPVSTNENEKKIDSDLYEKINKQQENMNYMAKCLEQSKVDILKINNEQKRIINLIKKLHGIKSSSS